MKKAFDFFVFGNFWVALCAAAQGMLTYLLVEQQPSKYIISVLFLATFFIYNIRIVLNYSTILKNKDRYTSNRMRCVSKHVKLIRFLTYGSVLLLLPLIPLIHINSLLSLAVTAFLAFAYSLPILKTKGGGLRQIPAAKTFLISLIWASCTVLVPILDSGAQLSYLDIVLLFTKRFILVFCLAVIFDIRDIEADLSNGLKTIANVLGPAKAKMLCYVLIIAHSLLITLYDLPLHPSIYLALVIFLLIVAWFIYRSFPKKSDYFYLFWVDGMFVLQYLLILSSSYFERL
ncbi:UbiA family prenyltransferase [Solitalea sp. MAHUQ-68]|uniref:UbiA family prenyltransferase n=1 Tax=Solitalea agri TaxID=2953739 RepID=A0A9X2F6X9_9SPHI|nr:UbiA family prenyltransferase [Solitalea agri]MCO4293476.1 UbiA family prenyltransferase [Solitalea agri]